MDILVVFLLKLTVACVLRALLMYCGRGAVNGNLTARQDAAMERVPTAAPSVVPWQPWPAPLSGHWMTHAPALDIEDEDDDEDEPDPFSEEILTALRQDRLVKPDFDGVELHLGFMLPWCVRAFYLNSDEVLREDLVVHAPRWRGRTEQWPIRHYLPADGKAQKEWNEEHSGLRTFRFAVDPLGNHYVLRPDRPDPAVWVRDRRTGRMAFVCPRFSDFIRARREAQAPPRRLAVPPRRMRRTGW
jgi:hypothetical protein